MMRKLSMIITALVFAGIGFAGITASPAHAANPVPYPAALAGHPFAKEWSLQELASSTWTTADQSPGNCPASPSQVSLVNNSYVQLNSNGQVGNCTVIQSPHTYPTVPGYVYEAEVYESTAANWSSMWTTGVQWPADGELDATEFLGEQNYVSWHDNPCQSGVESSRISTANDSGPCFTHVPAQSANFAPHEWVIVDYAFTTTGVDIYYNGQLYAHVPENLTQGNDPMWLVFDNRSCQSNSNGDVCAVPSDATVAGNFGIKYFRAFS